MNPDKLIRNNAYLYTDADGQVQTILFHKVANFAGQRVYNFQTRVGFINLTEQIVLDSVIPNPRTRV